MARLSYYLLASLAILGANASSAVIDLIPDNFDKVVLQSSKPALVEFFAPWCGHCKTLAPTYEELGQKFAYAGNKLSIAKVDADEHKTLGRRFGVQGFPTIKWFDGKSDKPEEYNGGRDIDSLASFITDKTGLKPRAKKASLPSPVQMLDDRSFKKEIGGDKDVLVAFTTPWCGHCKNLAPVWETVANDFASEPTVLIAKVDCEEPYAKATAQEQDIKSYPTIKYFPKGSTTPEIYKGGRSEKDFIDFLNKHAGTHRTVGGGLDEKAGTIQEMDEVVSKLLKDGSLTELIDQAGEIANKLPSESAKYYLRVLQKMQDQHEYPQRELERLERLIRKGGVVRKKMDQLGIKMNILRKFIEYKKDARDEL